MHTILKIQDYRTSGLLIILHHFRPMFFIPGNKLLPEMHMWAQNGINGRITYIC